MHYVTFLIRKALFAHLLVPLWKDRDERRFLRNQVMADLCEAYLKDFPVVVPEGVSSKLMPGEYVFSMWLQGEECAPRLVKSCWDSVRRHCPEELVVLDSSNITQWIDLPGDFLRKWRSGEIKACHVADLCRVELLWKYGGYWMDATNYMCHSMPDFIAQSPFFVYMSGRNHNTFIQNCFIRAHAHHPIVGAWREILRSYWESHSRAFDYYLPHRLLRHVVLTDARVSELFGQMPHVPHDCTHAVRWGGYWEMPFNREKYEELVAEGAFQKLEYKSHSAKNPAPGTFADYFVRGRV